MSRVALLSSPGRLGGAWPPSPRRRATARWRRLELLPTAEARPEGLRYPRLSRERVAADNPILEEFDGPARCPAKPLSRISRCVPACLSRAEDLLVARGTSVVFLWNTGNRTPRGSGPGGPCSHGDSRSASLHSTSKKRRLTYWRLSQKRVSQKRVSQKKSTGLRRSRTKSPRKELRPSFALQVVGQTCRIISGDHGSRPADVTSS